MCVRGGVAPFFFWSGGGCPFSRRFGQYTIYSFVSRDRWEGLNDPIRTKIHQMEVHRRLY